MGSSFILAPMDIQTLSWLTDAIDTAPNLESLEGVKITVEWFYEMDKDFKSYSYLIDRINEKSKLL